MERRVLLAIFLSFVVLYGYQAAVLNHPEAGSGSDQRRGAPAAQQSCRRRLVGRGSTRGGPASLPPPTPHARDVVVENAQRPRRLHDPRGALKSWRLKRYSDAAGQPLELIPQHVPAGTAAPFTISTDDPNVSARLASANFTSSADNVSVQGPQTLTFQYRDGDLVAEKAFAFVPDKPYVVTLNASLTVNGQPQPLTVHWGPALGTGIVQHSRGYNPAPQAIFFKERKVTRVAPAKLLQQAVQEGTFGFAGVDDHYFLSALVDVNQPIRVDYHPLDVQVEGVPRRSALRVLVGALPVAAARAQVTSSARKISTYSSASIATWFARSTSGCSPWLVVPLLRALKWVNSYVGNYGWSLIILHRADQSCDVPVAPQERGVDAENAGDSARGQSDSGSLRQAQDERSGEIEDERRDDEPLPRAGRESGQRLRADAADDAGPLRVLLDAGGRDRAARRAVHRSGFTTWSRPILTTSCPCSWASRCSCSSG